MMKKRMTDESYEMSKDEYLFFRKPNDLKMIEVLNEVYENSEQYSQKMRAAVLFQWDKETNSKDQLSIPNIFLEFTKSMLIRSKNGDEFFTWTVSFPNPKKIEFEDTTLYFNQHISVYDDIFLDWNESDVINTKLPSDFVRMKGKVKKIDKETIVASFKLKKSLHPPDYSFNPEEKIPRIQYDISFGPSTTITERKLKAIENLASMDNSIQRMILGIGEPAKTIVKINIEDNAKINLSQKEAISKALKNDFTLIQGPPGCGKTHVIATIVQQLVLTKPNERILVCGPSNISIENLVRAISLSLKVINQGIIWSASMDQDFESLNNLTDVQKSQSLFHILQDESPNGKRFKELTMELWNHKQLSAEKSFELSQLRAQLEKELLNRYPVICCTLVSAGKALIREQTFSTVIIDEASQSLEPETLIPLSNDTKRYILVGDQMQLGPNLIQSPQLQKIHYDRSLFDRLANIYNMTFNFALLDCQYRMHPKICRFSNEKFYDGLIHNGISEEDRLGCIPPISFIKTNGFEVLNMSSYYNTEETKKVKECVEFLYSKGVKKAQIGVITPYGAQAERIRQKFRILKTDNDLRVASVDSFQGNERDYIIVSLTRTNTEELSEFFKDRRRANVTLTRAKYGLIIIGNFDLLENSQNIWGDLCKFCSRNNYLKTHLSIEQATKKKIKITKDVIYDPFIPGIKGLNMKTVPISISNGEMFIIWPDDDYSMKYLKNWVDSMIRDLNSEKQVVLSIDAGPICIQIGKVFDSSFDPFSDYSTIPDIGDCKGVLVMFYCKNKNKVSFDEISKILNPLLTHSQVTILTFDFTHDYHTLKNIGIDVNTTRLIDAQTFSIPQTETNILEYTDINGIRDLILNSNCIDSNIQRAKDWILEGIDSFPRDINTYVINERKLPQICFASEQYFKHAANSIPLIALANKVVFQNHKFRITRENTQKFITNFNEKEFPLYFRQAQFLRPKLANILQCSLETTHPTVQLIDLWKKHSELLEVAKYVPYIFKSIFRFELNYVERIKSRCTQIEEVIKKTEEHMNNIYSTVTLVKPKWFDNICDDFGL